MPASFGRRLLDTPAADALALERDAGLTASFGPLDSFLDSLLRRSLAGERVLVVERTRARGTTAEFPGLAPDLSAWMRAHRSLGAVQAAGFWSTPQKGSVVAGPASTAWSLRERGRFGPQVSADERGRLDLDSAEAIAAWSLAAPAFDSVYSPVYLRTTQAGTGGRPTQIAAWQGVADTLDALGVPYLDAFEAVRYGNGWSRLGTDERHDALVQYTQALHDALPDDAGARLRLWLTRSLVERYYGRAKADGTVLMDRAVTAAFRSTLVGLWGGDWTAFVAYLGERLHPQEHVATAIPSADLTAPPTRDLAAVASETGAALADVEAVAAAVFGASPAQDQPERLNVLRRYWSVFDAAHARQTPGMSSPWGLVDSGSLGPPPNDGSDFTPDLFRTLLPGPLVRDIEALWSGELVPRFPDRILTEWTPHARMAEALGPALVFWEGVALTAWFTCEGPYSRTSFEELATYHARAIAELADAGAPVDPAFLREIVQADRLLGPERQVWDDGEHSAIDGTSFAITVRIGQGSRRDGFETVRDVITKARRAWARAHLDAYLERRQADALRTAAERYHVAVNAHGGRPPTARQAAKDAAVAVNLWLGGDVGAFYQLLGEKPPAPVTDGRRVTRPPHEALAHLNDAFAAMGTEDDATGSTLRYAASNLLRPATEYVRWLEATDERPDADRIKGVTDQAAILGDDPDLAWSRFVAAVDAACLSTAPALVSRAPRPIQTATAPVRVLSAQHASSPPAQPQNPQPSEPATPLAPWWKRIFGG